MESITTMMPPSNKRSPSSVSNPCESNSLITPTSLITRETVTPIMLLSW